MRDSATAKIKRREADTGETTRKEEEEEGRRKKGGREEEFAVVTEHRKGTVSKGPAGRTTASWRSIGRAMIVRARSFRERERERELCGDGACAGFGPSRRTEFSEL